MASIDFNANAQTYGPKNAAERELLDFVSDGGGSKGKIFGCMMKGANLSVGNDKPGEEGWTPLMYAFKNRSDEAIEVLLHFNVDIDARTKEGDTALMGVIRSRRVDTHKKEWEADTDFRLSRQLIRAYEDGMGDINLQNRAGETALIVATKAGQWDFVSRILDAGADPFVKDGEGYTAVDYARATNPESMAHAGSEALRTMEALASRKQAQEAHIDAGLPTQSSVAVKKPLSFRK
ncbi:MAG: ankyrin repeat domain-containing protein [Alphaproteobacteria bacterium]